MASQSQPYLVGVMKILVEEQQSPSFHTLVSRAVAIVEEHLIDENELRMDLVEFSGPHLVPTRGAYNPLDFLELGLSEKLERRFDFLLIVTEVELSASIFSYVLAYPSQLTNIGILSTKRLSPVFWGEGENFELTANRLATLLLHTLAHVLGLSHHSDPENILFDMQEVDDLDKMKVLREDQKVQLRRNLSRHAFRGSSGRNWWSFRLRQVWKNRDHIWRAVVQSNPIRLVTKLPTMFTAALSVIIALFFNPEPWDIGSTVNALPLAVFTLLAMAGATVMLYSSFSFGSFKSRKRLLTEGMVVTEAATLISLLLTLLLMYLVLCLLIFLGALTLFPRELMETWPTIDPAVTWIDHVRLSLFLGGVGLLAGSLGGRADSPRLIRSVIFLDEET